MQFGPVGGLVGSAGVVVHAVLLTVGAPTAEQPAHQLSPGLLSRRGAASCFSRLRLSDQTPRSLSGDGTLDAPHPCESRTSRGSCCCRYAPPPLPVGEPPIRATPAQLPVCSGPTAPRDRSSERSQLREIAAPRDRSSERSQLREIGHFADAAGHRRSGPDRLPAGVGWKPRPHRRSSRVGVCPARAPAFEGSKPSHEQALRSAPLRPVRPRSPRGGARRARRPRRRPRRCRRRRRSPRGGPLGAAPVRRRRVRHPPRHGRRRAHRARRHRHRPRGRGPRRRRGRPARPGRRRGAAVVGDAPARAALAPPGHRRPPAVDLPQAREPRDGPPGRRGRRAQPHPADRAGAGSARSRPAARRRHPRLRGAARAARRAGLHARGDGHRPRGVRGARRHRRHLPAHRRAPGARGVLGRRGERAALLRRRRPALGGAGGGAARPGLPRAAAHRAGTRAGGRAGPRPREQPAATGAPGAPRPGHPGRGHGVARARTRRLRSWSCSPTCCRRGRWC